MWLDFQNRGILGWDNRATLGILGWDNRATLRILGWDHRATSLGAGRSKLDLARASIVLFSVWLVILPQTLYAADRVWLEPPRPTSTQSRWYPRAIATRSGTVVALDAQQLRWLPAGSETEVLIAAHRVVWAEPELASELESEAIGLFVDGKYAESLSRLPGILQQRPPVWRQQWLTMMASIAAWKSGRSRISLELVSQLDRRPLPPLAIAWLPVAWTNGTQGPDAVAAAENRLSDPSPAVQLVSASWLLSSADRSRAVAVLNQLRSGQREEIAQLAEVLLWRTATPPQVAESATQWQNKLDALPIVLQTGPTKTLVDKFRSAGRTEAADRLEWSLELTPIHSHFP
jgi:hypothetical protein